MVVYFYPAAFTGGCNLQAHTFAENHDKFAAAGASVIGVSLDSIARLNDFSADPKYCAGKLPVASDEKGEIAKSYDVKITDTYKGQPVATMKDSRGNEIGHRMAERDPRGYPGRSCHPPPSAEYRCTNALKLFS